MTIKLFSDLADWLTAHSSKTFLLLKIKYLFYQMAISNKMYQSWFRYRRWSVTGDVTVPWNVAFPNSHHIRVIKKSGQIPTLVISPLHQHKRSTNTSKFRIVILSISHLMKEPECKWKCCLMCMLKCNWYIYSYLYFRRRHVYSQRICSTSWHACVQNTM